MPDITSNLIGWWKMDEGSGTTTVDSTTNANNGTLAGTTKPSWTTGKIGNALSFNGSTSTVQVGNKAALRLTGGAVTVSAWVKANSIGNMAIYYDGQNGVACEHITLGVGNYGCFGNMPSKWAIVVNTTSSTAIARSLNNAGTGAWVHLCGVYDGSTLKFYLNGSLEDTRNLSGNINSGASQYVTLGGDSSGTARYVFDGIIDDVRIYDRALSSTDVSALYAWTDNITTSQTQTGKARIQVTTTQTQSGKARIQKTSTSTQTGKARVAATTAQIQTGKARVQASVLKTQSGVARLQVSATASQTGTANIRTTTLRTQTGTTRVQASSLQSQAGKSRIQIISSLDQLGAARIQITSTTTQTGTARVQISQLATQTGVGRIQITATYTQQGKSRVQIVSVRTQTGVARIQTTAEQLQAGMARVQQSVSADQTGLAKIYVPPVQRTITGLSRVQTSHSPIIQGLARILSPLPPITRVAPEANRSLSTSPQTSPVAYPRARAASMVESAFGSVDPSEVRSLPESYPRSRAEASAQAAFEELLEEQRKQEEPL